MKRGMGNREWGIGVRGAWCVVRGGIAAAAALLLAGTSGSAQQRPAVPAVPAVQGPGTTPPEQAGGVYGSARARELLTRLMDRRGFTVYIIGDMEGLAAVVRNATEMRPTSRGGDDREHDRFREQLTDEINAVIAGARAAGATQFVVNDGHGGTLALECPATGGTVAVVWTPQMK